MGTAPQPKEKTLSAAEPVSRLEKMEEEGRTPNLPPSPAPYLVRYLMDIGPVEAAGMDGAPISWREIEAWEGRQGVTLQPWESSLLRRLSRDYLDQCRKSRDPDCPAPWGVITEAQRRAVDAKLRSAFGGLARNRAQA